MRGKNGMKLRKGMLSLILNYRETLRDIEKNYKDGNFFIFESDIIKSKDIDKMNDFMDSIVDKDWDSIHVGMFQKNIYDYPITEWITGYRGHGEGLPLNLIQFLNKNCQRCARGLYHLIEKWGGDDLAKMGDFQRRQLSLV